MAQAERKARQLIAAAIRWVECNAFERTNPNVIKPLEDAAAEYKAVKHTEELVTQDPGVFLCPHCGAPRPAYGWHFNLGDTGPFALQWITCFCGECRKMISVSVVQFMPKAEMLEQLKAQFAGKLQA